MLKHLAAASAALCLLVSVPARADYPVKNATGATQIIGAFTLSGASGVQVTKHVLVDATGAAIPVALDSSLQSMLTQLQALLAIAQGTDPTIVTQSATSTFSVAKTTGIGSTGTNSVVTTINGAVSNQQSPTDGTLAVLVSQADTINRRTARNTGSTACEFMPSALALGNGHPLPANESWNFDGSGRMTGAIYVACAPGGAVSVITY